MEEYPKKIVTEKITYETSDGKRWESLERAEIWENQRVHCEWVKEQIVTLSYLDLGDDSSLLYTRVLLKEKLNLRRYCDRVDFAWVLRDAEPGEYLIETYYDADGVNDRIVDEKTIVAEIKRFFKLTEDGTGTISEASSH